MYCGRGGYYGTSTVPYRYGMQNTCTPHTCRYLIDLDARYDRAFLPVTKPYL